MGKKDFRKVITLLLAAVLMFSSIPLVSALPGDGQPLDFPWDFEDQDLHGIIVNDRGGTAAISLATGVSYGGGEHSVLVSNRTTIAAGPLIDLTKYITAGSLYRASVWVYNPGTSNVTYSIRVQSGVCDERVPDVRAEKYLTIVSRAIAGGAWGELSYDMRYDDADYHGFYVETTTAGSLGNFYIDNVSFSKINDSTYMFDPTLPSLKKAYEDYFLLGTIITPTEIRGVRNEAVRRHFNVVTCENLMKPVYMSTAPGVYTPEKGDIMQLGAEDAGILMHGHTLAWHSQSAPWLNPAGTTRAQAMINMEEFIKNIAGHYAGRILSWDVVNEIMGTTAPSGDWKRSVTSTPWRTAFANGADASKGEDGTDFIYYAFVFARKYDPYAILYYNDFSMNNANKVDAVCLMVKDLNARYAIEFPDDPRPLIEGVGMQNHDSVTSSIAQHEAAILKLIDAGVIISITELDITVRGNSNTPANLEEQARVYAEFFYLFKKYAEHIERVTFWGLDDLNNWRPTGYVQLFNEDLSAKPAFWAVIDPEGYLGRDKIPPPAAKISITGPANVINGPGATAKYTISAEGMPTVSGIELQFELDGDYLGANAFNSANFDILGEGNYGSPIFWRNDGNKWIGTVTLFNSTGIRGGADILDMVLSLKDGILGETDVKLNYIILSYAGNNVLADIKNGVVTTTFDKYFLPYDLNKDGVVDLNDITYALQFLMAEEGDSNWDAAKAADLNDDGYVDIEDLLLILANYTIPYYSW